MLIDTYIINVRRERGVFFKKIIQNGKLRRKICLNMNNRESCRKLHMRKKCRIEIFNESVKEKEARKVYKKSNKLII